MENVYLHSNIDKYNVLGFYADVSELFRDYTEFELFIKGCEHAVRTDKRYTSYISKLKSNNMIRCAILGNLKENEKNKMEMHHGPIFTLFDICEIVFRDMAINNKKEITTFKVADIVLTEHEKDNIQIIMLSKGVHKAKHNLLNRKDIFIHIRSSIGRIDRFIDRHHDGMQVEHFESMERYIRLCKKHPESIDNGLFDTANRLLSFKEK